MLRFFEPLITRALKKYENSHDVLLHQSILSLLSVLIKFGVCPHLSFYLCLYDSSYPFLSFFLKVDFPRLDKEHKFLDCVLNQITSKQSYLPHAPELLPYLFDFIGLLYIVRRHFPEVLPPEYLFIGPYILEYLVSLISFCCFLNRF